MPLVQQVVRVALFAEVRDRRVRHLEWPAANEQRALELGERLDASRRRSVLRPRWRRRSAET